jgi:hypothetical protein
LGFTAYRIVSIQFDSPKEPKESTVLMLVFLLASKFTFLGSLGFTAYGIVSKQFDIPKEPRKASTVLMLLFLLATKIYFPWLLGIYSI